jgi:hypothetical protein
VSWEGKRVPTMRVPKRFLVWAPRFLGVQFAAFLALFATDVVFDQQGVGSTVVAVATHLVPTAVVALMLAIAWRRATIGGLLFVFAALGYAAFVEGGNHPHSWIVPISGPLFLIGILFLMKRRVAN